MNHRLVSSPILRLLIFASVLVPCGLSRAVDPGSPVTATPTATGTPATTTSPIPSDAPPAPVVPTETPQNGQPATGMPSEPKTTTGVRPSTYTVVSGDTLWVIAHKFNTSIRKLKKVNHLKRDFLRPGQVLKIPSAHSSSAPAKKTTTLSHEASSVADVPSRHAEPAQNFDLPVSPFSGSPAPAVAVKDSTEVASTVADSTIPASPTSTEPTYPQTSGPLPADASASPLPATAPYATVAHSSPALTHSSRRSTRKTSFPRALAVTTPDAVMSAPAIAAAPLSSNTSSKRDHSSFNFFYTPPPSVDWGTRFTQVARNLGDQGLEYDESWCPPGESHSWSMDCSNTTRYLYRATAGIQLPRTASDQYYYLHLQNKAWDVPQLASGFADCNYLRQNLKPGDLLFWENTYKPDRQPPITHVMIFLGTNTRGQWIMAGSQSTRGGEHNRRHGGPDIYVFNPTRPSGGYSTWLGLVHHRGRFCAFGRPLEADKSKLAVAAND